MTQLRDTMTQQQLQRTYTWVHAIQESIELNPNTVRRKRMCGYEFRPGDMAWNCRQCQKDETCVLCHECFSSSHGNLNHDVTFYYTQQGTGCCDCGDEEAWNPAGFCSEHNPPDDVTGDILTSIPFDILEEAQNIVSLDLEMLQDYAQRRREGYRRTISREDPGFYDLWLHVSEANIRSAPEKMTLVQGNINAESVFHWLSSLNHANTSLFDAGDIKVYADALAAFARLTNGSLACDLGCRLIANEMSRYPMLLHRLIKVEALLPQAEAAALHTLIMALLPDPAFKEAFAIAYTECYSFIFSEYLHGLGNQGQTILIFGVQFLNRASFVHKLMANHDLLTVLLGSFEGALLHASIPISFQELELSYPLPESLHPWDDVAKRVLEPWTSQDLPDIAMPIVIKIDSTEFTSHRYVQVLMDLKYVCQIPHIGFFERFASKYEWLCRLLSQLQNIGASARIQPTEPHVAVENRSWIVCIELVSMLEELVSSLVSNIIVSHANDSSLIHSLLAPLMKTFCMWLATTKYYFPRHIGLVGEPSVMVGAHFPLHHAILLILRGSTRSVEAMGRFESTWNSLWPHSNESELGQWHRLMVAIPLIRALVWDAQVHVGLWKRNGWSAVNHSMNYGEPYYSMKFRDIDILGIQYAVHVSGMDSVIDLILSQFDSTGLHQPEYNDLMLAECLKVFCQLATELPMENTSLLPALRRLLILRLCSKPSSHSELVKAVAEYCAVHEVHTAFDPIATDAAVKVLLRDFVIPNQKNYTLDSPHYENYDATTIHLTRKQHEAARLNRLEHRIESYKRNKTKAVYYPAVPPPLHLTEGLLSVFEPAYFILLHPKICTKVETIVLEMDESPSWLSTMVIHLITLQLYALRVALDHPSYQTMGQEYLGWLSTIVPKLEQLNPWRTEQISQENVDHERGRHIQWILHEISIYPSFHSIPYTSALESTALLLDSNVDSLRHRAQQMALLKMQQQQAAFSDFLDESPSDDEMDPLTICVMCHANDNTSLCFVGFVHPSCLNVRSGLIKKTPWEDMKKEVPLTMQCCGHCVHMSCWEAYYATQFQKVITGESYLNPVDVKKGEFLCPLCKAISNVLVPVMPEPQLPAQENLLNESFSWLTWLEESAGSTNDLSPLTEGLAKLCMSIHRVATGAVEKAYPDRYITTACHAVFTTRWTATLTGIPLNRFQPLMSAARNLRHPELTIQLKQLLAHGHTIEPLSTAVETHTLTQVQKTWHSVVGRKPLLIYDLGSIGARGVLLSDSVEDSARFIQLTALAYVVQTSLWVAQSIADRFTIDADAESTAWFLSKICGDSSIEAAAQEIPKLVGIKEDIGDAHRFIELIALDVKLFCQELQSLIAPYNVPWISITPLPKALAELVSTWIHAYQTTYDEMQDPQGVLATWKSKQQIVTWADVLQKDLDTAHIPLSVIWFHRRTEYLKTLPTSYNMLYSHLTKQVCPNCQLFPARPALCLICGSLLCAASTCKAMSPMAVSGACTLHAHKCGRGVGLFLLVLEGNVLLVNGKLAAFYSQELYVDEYGEGFGENHSIATYRGRPLYLQTQTRDQLIRLWTQQAIPIEIVQIQNIVTKIVTNSYY